MKKLYIKQKVFKIRDHYSIYNQYGKKEYYVDQDFKLIGNTVRVRDANGKKVFTIDKKIFNLLPKFTVYFDDGRKIYLSSKLSLFRRKISIKSKGLSLSLKGSVFDYNFDIYDGFTKIASIKKAVISWGDSFQIKVYDESYQDIAVAIMIAVDHLQDVEEARRSSGNGN